MTALADLRALAEQATPGEWEALDAEGDEINVVPWVGVTHEDGSIRSVTDDCSVADARFIAAFGPKRARALVAVAEAAQALELAAGKPIPDCPTLTTVFTKDVEVLRAALAGLGITAEETSR